MHSSCGCFINNKYFRKLLLFVAMLRLVAWRRVSEVDTFVVVVYVLSLLPVFAPSSLHSRSQQMSVKEKG